MRISQLAWVHGAATQARSMLSQYDDPNRSLRCVSARPFCAHCTQWIVSGKRIRAGDVPPTYASALRLRQHNEEVRDGGCGHPGKVLPAAPQVRAVRLPAPAVPPPIVVISSRDTIKLS